MAIHTQGYSCLVHQYNIDRINSFFMSNLTAKNRLYFYRRLDNVKDYTL